MRKTLLSMLLMSLISVVTFAAKEDSYLLHQGFEEGAIPADWTQEYVEGHTAWAVEADAQMTYPTGAYLGSYSATLRNTTAQTQHYVTRLISPVINLSEAFQPILVFSHAQPQRTGDIDTLRVYYRTSAEGRWVKLAEYNSKITSWQTDTIDLTGASATYQICFEGTDNFGRGISLDEIIVRPMPTCDDPSNVTVDGLTTNSATLRWNGSLDTDSFQLVLSKTQITDIASADASAIVFNGYVSDFSYQFVDLTRNQRYYAYIQANCGLEQSEWVEVSFSTKNLASVPYTQTFNLNYASGTINHVAYWSYGTSIKKDDGSMEYMPFVNQNATESKWKDYSYSQTTCLAFTGARNLTAAIPAGEYVYAATPEMDVNRIQDVMVTFWGTVYDKFGDDYKSGLVVGVMTDPADYSTFVPVDTVFVKGEKEYARFSVYFRNYTGDGKYIAFASDFLDKDNMFFLDEVEVKMAGTVGVATDVVVSDVHSQSITVDANVHGAQQVKIVVARDTADAVSGAIYMTPAGLPASYILAEHTVNATELPYTVTGLAGGQLVQVYVTTMDGANEVGYALPEKALLPVHWDGVNDLTIDFEKRATDWRISQLENFSSAISATNTYPLTMQYELEVEPGTSSNSNYFISRYPLSDTGTDKYGHGNTRGCVMLKSERREFGDGIVWTPKNGGQGISLPEVDTIQNLVLKFYLKAYSTTNPTCSRVRVGVVENPRDFSTFVEVARFDGTGDYRSCVVSFANYTGNGHYPVILSTPSDVEYSGGSGSGSGRTYKDFYTSNNIIDDVTLMGPSGCLPPAAVTIEAQDTVATLTWGSNGQTEWLVSFYDKSDALLDSARVNTTSYVFHNLLPHTTYKYSVVTVCDGVVTDGDINEFKTECAPGEAIPYVESFEGYAKYGSELESESPACWYFPRYLNVVSEGSGGTVHYYYYPYVTNSGATYAHSGTAGIYWYYSSTSTLTTDGILALPRMAADLNALQLSFWMKPNSAAYASDTIYVGAMSDPTDLSTFDTVAAIRVGSNEYKERIVRFENYTGNGQYIALRRPRATAAHFIYLDDFRVDSLSNCEKVMDVAAKNMNEHGASFTWTSQSSTQWEVVLATADTTLGSNVEVGGSVLGVYTTTSKPFAISDCPTPNTQYYVYVRAICGEGNKGDWSQPCTFKTTCVPVTVGAFGTETFSTADAIDCWTVGVREGTTAKPSRNTNGYLYLFNTTASDGAYAVMPMLDIDSINRLQISFDAHGGTGAAYLREVTVGIITNPSDLSTFSALKTVSLNRVSATTAAVGYGFNEGLRYTVRFDEYEGDYNGDFGKQIMFLSESGELGNYIYIDNVTIDTIPSCPEPIDIALVEANANDLTLTWDSLGGEYEVKLTKGTTVVADTIVGTSTLTIDGLEMLQKYDVQVRHICGAGDTSVWSNVRSFSTACPAVYQLPYSESFENYTILTVAPYSQPNCWNGWYDGGTASYCRMYATAKYQGAAGYYMGSTTGNATTAPKEAIAVLPAIDQLSSAQLSFFAKGSTTTGTRGIAVGISEYADDLDSVLAHVVWIDSVTTISGTWAPYTFNLTSYTGEGKHIVLRCFGGNTSATTLSTTALYTYLDDIYVERVPSCFRPYGLAMTSATATSATLNWTPQGNETAWDIAYVTKGGALTDATITTVNSVPAMLNGLSVSSEYDFYVRANCGDGDVSAWSDLTSGATLCQIPLAAASWDFDDATNTHPTYAGAAAAYILENCWLSGATGGGSTTNIPYNVVNTVNANYLHGFSYKYSLSGNYALKIYSTAGKAAYAVMPEIEANLDTLQLRFKARAVYYSGSTTAAKYSLTYSTSTGTTKYPHAIKVGTCTDPYDISTFDMLTEYTLQDIAAKDTAAMLAALPAEDRYPDAFWEEVIVPLYGAKGKYIVFLSDYGVTNNVFIDDLVVEKESGCSTPGKLEATNIEPTSASFAWGSSKSQWNVKVEMDNSIVAQAVVDSLGWTVDNLESHANYTFSVQAVCSAEETSEWASLSFSTPCAPFDTAGFATDFQDVEPYFGNATYNLPGCWDGGQLTKASATAYTYMPQAIANTTANQYSRGLGTTDRALRFYHATTYGDSYVILPNMDFELDSVALHFWMRAAYFYTPTHSTASNRNKLASANNNYEKNLVIGAIADPTDMTTFVALDTVTYTQSWSSTTNVLTTGDATGNDYWEEVTLPLKKYAGKGQLVLFYPFNAKASYMFIDDLSIVGADFCTAASGLRVSNLTAHSATLNWMVAGKDSVQLQVAKNSNEFKASDIVVDQVLTNAEGVYTATNLASGQDYYFRVKHFCSAEEEADWTSSALFVTDYEVRFEEKFEEVRTYPVDWTRHSVKVADIFGGAEMSAPIVETATGWTRQPNDGDMYASTGTGTGTGTTSTVTYYNYWLLTPTIDLTQQSATDSLMLSFDLRLTNNNNQLPFNQPAEDDQFIVAISVDGGKTFARENATVWGFAADDDRSYATISGASQLVTIDMSQYVGNDVKIAFVQNSLTTTGKPSSKNYLHIDNVTLNRYTASEYEAQICRWNDYVDRNFSIDADDLQVGQTTTYSRYDRSATIDKMTTLNLTVSKDTLVRKEATVCEGEDYTEDGFNIIDARASYTYRQKLEGQNTCDSIVELQLTVNPRVRTNMEQTICQGDYYEFNGVKYYTNTIHTDTLQSAVTGCDSIVTLYLTVNAILRGEEDVHLCPGETYNFGKFGAITEAGTYVDTLQNALGCDSVATITVSLHETAASTVRALICQGETYNESVWAGLTKAGDYPSQQKTVYGCDSIVTLHLMVADATLSLIDSIAVDELPYVLNGVELLPAATEEGVYVKQVQLSCGTAAVTIVVGHPTSLHSVMANSLGVTPNPATVGEQIRVMGNFPAGSMVRVLSATGALVYTEVSGAENIILPGMPVAGAYLVTVTAEGRTYQSKLVVK